jgi:REP-associated tyrosine transposase
LVAAEEKMERRYQLKEEGVDFQRIVRKIADLTEVEAEIFLSRDRQRKTVQARSLLCYWVAEELGMTQPEIGLILKITQPAVSLAIKRGKKFTSENKINFNEVIKL